MRNPRPNAIVETKNENTSVQQLMEAMRELQRDNAEARRQVEEF